MENLQNLEIRRIQINKKIRAILFILAPLSLLIGFLIAYYVQDASLSIIVALWIFIFFYIVFKKRILGNFEDEFKHRIIAALVREIDPNLIYLQNKYIPYTEFNFANLYPNSYDIFIGNDLIMGEIDGVGIKFSDICMQKEEKYAKNEFMVNIFYGIFFEADFNKFFHSFSAVIDKKSHNASTIYERAYMDDSEFEQIFNVYTKNQIEARYILTPSFMEKLTQIRKFFNCPVNAVFYKNKIYLYIERGVDSFELNFKKPLIGENSAISWYKDEIKSFIDLVKILNLNSKAFKIV